MRSRRVLLSPVIAGAALLGGQALASAHDGPAAHGAAKCSDYPNQAAAQRAADTRDADHDGIYCEALPCPCLKPGQPGGGSEPRPRRHAHLMRGRVTSVVDGDTIKVRTSSPHRRRYTVRLLGIDTPETKKPGTPVECGGRQASRHMRRLALSHGKGRRVTLTTDPSQHTYDRYHRLLAYARTSSGKQLNVSQVAAGWAITYVYGHKPFRQLSRFRRAERRARRAHRGVWGQCGDAFHTPA